MDQYESLNTAQRKKVKHEKKVTHPDLDKAMYLWVVQQRSNHVILTSDLIRAKAASFHEKLCIIEKCAFSASYGWFTMFKNRHGLKVRRMHGEKLSADVSSLAPFKEKLHQLIREKGLKLDEIYNADESALFFKMLPSRSVVLGSEAKVSGHKACKDRFTFMPCCNATGTHKLKLQIIGKSLMPRCFGKKYPANIVYQSSKKAWQTRQLFQTWFHEHFVVSVRKFACEKRKSEAKALLILDNCSAHNQTDTLCSDDELIQVIFLPPNVTAEAQPMDQGVIVCAKNNYRKLLLEYLLINNNNTSSIPEIMKNFSLLKAISYLTEAWDRVSPSTILNSWSKLLGDHELYCKERNERSSLTEEEPPIDESMLFGLARRLEPLDPNDIEAWLKACCSEPTAEEYSDSDICEFVKGNVIDETNQHDTIESDEEDTNDVSPIVENPRDDVVPLQKPKEILHHIDALQNLLEEHEVEKKIMLRNWRAEIFNKFFNNI